LGKPTIAINANFFDIRGQKGGSWKSTGCSSPLGAYFDNTRGGAPANAAVTGTLAYAGKQALSGGDEVWTALSTMTCPWQARRSSSRRGPNDYDAATPVIKDLMDTGHPVRRRGQRPGADGTR
jgi:hypothetical protein